MENLWEHVYRKGITKLIRFFHQQLNFLRISCDILNECSKFNLMEAFALKLHNFMANAIKQIVKIVSIWLTCTHSQKVSTYIRRQQQHLYASFFTFDLTRHSWDCYWFGLTAFGGHGKIQFDGNFEWGYLKNGMYVHWLKSAFETFL